MVVDNELALSSPSNDPDAFVQGYHGHTCFPSITTSIQECFRTVHWDALAFHSFLLSSVTTGLIRSGCSHVFYGSAESTTFSPLRTGRPSRFHESVPFRRLPLVESGFVTHQTTRSPNLSPSQPSGVGSRSRF